MTAMTSVAPFFGRPALVWLVDAGSFATVVGYLLVVVSFLLIYKRHPRLPRPYRIRRPILVGTLALLATVFFAILYLPGSPSALVWPFEWAIVLAWSLAGGILGVLMNRRLTAREKKEQAQYILGDYASFLSKSDSDNSHR
jgi:amino acid transporter